MRYTGIDYHKRYSVACTLDEQGRPVHETRIDANSPEAFAAYFKQLGEPSEVVIEARWNWATLYDLLETIEGVRKRRHVLTLDNTTTPPSHHRDAARKRD